MKMGHAKNVNQATGATKMTVSSNVLSPAHQICTPTSNKNGVYLVILSGALVDLTMITSVRSMKWHSATAKLEYLLA